LPANQREVLEMRYYGELSFKEIAEERGKKQQICKPGSVLDNHLSRHTVTDMLKRPTSGRQRAAATNALLGLAPDGVYTAGMSPRRR